jgi:1,4-dihydroxy-2-naphthoate polyprenyltransferase
MNLPRPTELRRATDTLVAVSPLPNRPRLADRTPRLWALWAASRPSQLALIVVVYALGLGMATAGPPVVTTGVNAGEPAVRLSAVGGALALVAVSVAIHYANEYADVEADALSVPTPFSGGSGALERTGLPASFLGRATVAALGISTTVVAAAAATGLLPTDALALLAVICLAGLAYSLPPLALVQRGLGEVVNAALGGLLLPVYGVAVVATPTATTWLAALPFALVVGCSLFATHWPDRRADAAVGKRTLVVRWSPGRIRRVYVVLAVAAVVVAGGLGAAGLVPIPVALAALVPAPFLVRGWTTLTRRRSPLPSVVAMVSFAAASTVAWWWVGLGP